jgi:hypothetical protein
MDEDDLHAEDAQEDPSIPIPKDKRSQPTRMAPL